MKNNYKKMKKCLLLTFILTLIETYFLIIAFDLKRIIISIIVYACFIAICIITIVLKLGVNKVIYECDLDDFKIRLIDYDDYQYIRDLLCLEEKENSIDEVKRLKKYETLTENMVKEKYHYVVFLSNQIVALFFTSDNHNVNIKKTLIEDDSLNNVIKALAKEKGIEVNISFD